MNTQILKCNERFGSAYTPADLTHWRTEDYMPDEHVAYLWGDECFLSPEFQASVPAVREAVEGLGVLEANGQTAVIVSDRPESLYDCTRAWLDERGLDHVPLIFTHHPSSARASSERGKSKAEIATEIGLTRVVEDAPHHAESLAALPSVERVYLLDKPYNRHVSGDKIVRVNSWFEVVLDHLTDAYLDAFRVLADHRANHRG